MKLIFKKRKKKQFPRWELNWGPWVLKSDALSTLVHIVHGIFNQYKDRKYTLRTLGNFLHWISSNFSARLRIHNIFHLVRWLTLLYPHFLKKFRVYCCYPFLSVRLSIRPKEKLSLELRLHFKDLRNDTLGSHWVCPVDAQ